MIATIIGTIGFIVMMVLGFIKTVNWIEEMLCPPGKNQDE